MATPAIRWWLLLVQAGPWPSALSAALSRAGIDVEQVRTGGALATALGRRPPDVILVDAELPATPLSELRALAEARAPGTPVVVMASPAAVPAAIEAVRSGAHDYVIKPLLVEDLLFVLEAACQANAAAASRPPVAPSTDPGEPIGSAANMRAVWSLVTKAALSQATVLIGGETGTGKELAARRIHQLSPRRSGPFVKVQGGALPDALFESELYGYERGAFTGAAVRKPGRVELAEKGTLFLDEIGDISPATQVKLLRLLQDREYERLGGTETRRADVRFVAATHRDLPAMVARGEFREDLFYRLNVLRVTLPPLRERREDLPALARHFASEACRTNGLPAVVLADSAIAKLLGQRWPGNVRQLQNLIERLVVLSESPTITADDVRRELADPAACPAPSASVEPEAGARESREMSAIDLKGAVSKAEQRQIEKALRKAKGSRDLAARLLGVSRRTLFYKLRLYGLA